MSLGPVAFSQAVTAERSTGAGITLLSCQCHPGSTNTRAAQGCTGCRNPGSG